MEFIRSLTSRPKSPGPKSPNLEAGEKAHRPKTPKAVRPKSKSPGRKKENKQKSPDHEITVAPETPEPSPHNKTMFLDKAFTALPINSNEVPSFTNLSQADCQRLLSAVPAITSMMDRTGEVPVTVFILSTLQNGLPLFNSKPNINRDIKFCLNYIFYRASKSSGEESARLMMKLAKAYQSCQTIQQQAITQMYALLCNVELTLESQTMQMLSAYKLRVCEEVVLLLNPGANLVDDSNPQMQPPHIYSAYVLALQEHGIHLPGAESSAMDVNKPALSALEKKRAVSQFKSSFSPDQFVRDFVLDVNATASVLARFIDQDKFYKWVMGLPEDTKFDIHSVFYDEDRKEDYDVAQPEADRLRLPYLRFDVAVSVLCIQQILDWQPEHRPAPAKVDEL